MPRLISDLRVLAVEDNPAAMELLKTMLSDLGISKIHAAKDGHEALICYQKDVKGVDVIICDWNLPEITGIELLRTVRAMNPDIPFIMVTGASDADSVVEAKNSGVSAYVAKPYSPDQLEKKLTVVVRVLNAKQVASK